MKRSRTLLLSIAMVFAVAVGVLMVTYSLSEPSPPRPYLPDEVPNYGLHNVEFIVIDVFGNPQTDLLMECSWGNISHHHTTNKHGACRYVVVGRNECVVLVYNATMDLQKEFRVYPVQSYYYIILEDLKA